MRFEFTPMVKNLLIINIGIFLLTMVGLQYMRVDFYTLFALHSWYSGLFRPWQFISHMFMHGDFGHLMGNMIGLVIFGPMLEKVWGAKRFLIFYLFTGIGAGLLYWGINTYQCVQVQNSVTTYLMNPNPDDFSAILKKYNRPLYDANIDFIDQFYAQPNDPNLINQTMAGMQSLSASFIGPSSVGASGAIFGILMASLLLFPNTERYYFMLPFPIKNKYLIGAYGLYEIYAEYMGHQDNIAHLAHLGGMFFAFILVKYWQKQRNTFY